MTIGSTRSRKLIVILCIYILIIAIFYAIGDISQIIYSYGLPRVPSLAAKAGLSQEKYEKGRQYIILEASVCAASSIVGSAFLVAALNWGFIGKIWGRVERTLMHHGPYIKAVAFRLLWSVMAIGMGWAGISIDGTTTTGKVNFSLSLSSLLGGSIGNVLYGISIFALSRRFKPPLAFALSCVLYVVIGISLMELSMQMPDPRSSPLPFDPKFKELRGLLQKVNFPEAQVYLIEGDGSASYVKSLLSEKIMLGSKLAATQPAEELTAVVAHELGHRVTINMAIYLPISILPTFLLQALFFLVILPTPTIYTSFGLESEPSIVGLSIAELFLSRIRDVTSVFKLYFTRHMEYLSDDYARQCGYGGALAKFLLTYAASQLEFSWLFEMLRSTHPASLKRAKRILGFS